MNVGREKGMILHHEGAIAMATGVAKSTNAEIKKLHDDIVRTQSEEISKMKVLLTTL